MSGGQVGYTSGEALKKVFISVITGCYQGKVKKKGDNVGEGQRKCKVLHFSLPVRIFFGKGC